MPKIFISYRRADSQYVTDTIYDYMMQHFGAENVFLDVGSIPFGVDFRHYLAEQIAAHDVILAIIGPEWGNLIKERANDENDFVRIEIENALKQSKLVIPVLVMEARMPSFKDLPASITDLQWRNSAIIRRKPDLENDCNRLAESIRQYTQTAGESASITPPPRTVTRKTASELAAAIRAIIGDPFELCDVPAGEFLYGENKEKLTLPAFAIAKYPITYSQFQTFIDAKDGLYEKHWWTGFRANDEHKRQPSNQAWKIASHPRENVSWYDALAFCYWLSYEIGEDDDVDWPVRWAVRLPTEFEWEKSARGKDGIEYPYGNIFDKSKCNTKESGIRQTTPVTQYPEGTSPYGVLDMSGNIWEWCLTNYDKPLQDAIEETIHSDETHVVRGGSFSFSFDLARTTYRSDSRPSSRGSDIGFRVVCRPTSA